MIYLLGALAGIVTGLAAYTWYRVRKIEAAFPADGEFVLAGGIPIHFHRYQATASQAELPSLVFIHGASGNAYDHLSAFRQQLEGRYDLIFVDRPGLGHSGRRGEEEADPTEQARLIGLALDALKVKRAVVLGHSLGAAVTAALALERPSLVEGLVFVAPATHPWPGGVTWYYRVAALPIIGRVFCALLTLPVAELVASRAIHGVFAPEKAPENYDAMIRLPLLFRPVSFRANAMDVARLKQGVSRLSRRYGEITIPAAVITGDRDTVVWPSIHSEGLMTDLPRARLVILPGAGHMPHHTRTGDIVREIERIMAETFEQSEASAGREEAEATTGE